MKAFQVVDHDRPPEVRNVADVAPPAAGEVMVRISACGLNFADLLIARGSYQERPELPLTLGMEFAGTVEATGEGVAHLIPGDRIAAFAGHGGLAEAACLPADRCLKLPEAMPFTEAAGFPVAYGTSHVALDHKARLQPGETLLVLGAAGGVGLTAVEIGKLMGATVIACARGPDKLEVARKAGADHLIDSDGTDIRDAVKELGGANVVYDPVGGAQFAAALRACNPDGRVIVIGFASGEVPQIAANHLLVKNVSVIGHYWGGYMAFRPKIVTDSLEMLFDWYAKGRIRPHIGHEIPLAQAIEGMELLRSRRSTGKVVITV